VALSLRAAGTMEQSCERAQRIPLADAPILGRGSVLGRNEEEGGRS
jgi:hypothetical protein